MTLPRLSWQDTRRVTVCFLPHSLVFGQDCLYTRTRVCTAVPVPRYGVCTSTKFSTRRDPRVERSTIVLNLVLLNLVPGTAVTLSVVLVY
jgi:hypothetical protein